MDHIRKVLLVQAVATHMGLYQKQTIDDAVLHDSFFNNFVSTTYHLNIFNASHVLL